MVLVRRTCSAPCFLCFLNAKENYYTRTFVLCVVASIKTFIGRFFYNFVFESLTLPKRLGLCIRVQEFNLLNKDQISTNSKR